MAIKREALKDMDFSDIATGKRMPAVHPGEVLLKEFIEPMGLTRYRVAKATHMQQRRIGEICNGARAITADTALRLGKAFGIEPQTWMNLQAQYDLEVKERELRKEIEEVSAIA